MRLIELGTFWTVVVDIIAWFIIHVGVAFILVRFSEERFRVNSWLFKGWRWERDGEIYQRLFKIRTWKPYLPDAAPFLGERGFPKRILKHKNRAYFTSFIRETCRAELTHWIIMLFAPLFFLWNPLPVGFLMIFYAVAENAPLVMAQRYNRHRLQRVIGRESIEEEAATNA